MGLLAAFLPQPDLEPLASQMSVVDRVNADGPGGHRGCQSTGGHQPQLRLPPANAPPALSAGPSGPICSLLPRMRALCLVRRRLQPFTPAFVQTCLPSCSFSPLPQLLPHPKETVPLPFVWGPSSLHHSCFYGSWLRAQQAGKLLPSGSDRAPNKITSLTLW